MKDWREDLGIYLDQYGKDLIKRLKGKGLNKK
jgi:hypothetical protein